MKELARRSATLVMLVAVFAALVVGLTASALDPVLESRRPRHLVPSGDQWVVALADINWTGSYHLVVFRMGEQKVSYWIDVFLDERAQVRTSFCSSARCSTDVSVRGGPVRLGVSTSERGDRRRKVEWLESERLVVTVVAEGSPPYDEIVAFAEDLRDATDEEWSDLLEVGGNGVDHLRELNSGGDPAPDGEMDIAVPCNGLASVRSYAPRIVMYLYVRAPEGILGVRELPGSQQGEAAGLDQIEAVDLRGRPGELVRSGGSVGDRDVLRWSDAAGGTSMMWSEQGSLSAADISIAATMRSLRHGELASYLMGREHWILEGRKGPEPTFAATC